MVLTTQEIFKEISEYQFDKDNILDFLLTNHDDKPSFYYFRHMLFNILETDTHLEPLIRFFYKLELGAASSREINIVDNGQVKQVKQSYLLEKEREKEEFILNRFVSGDTSILKELLESFARLIKEATILDHNTLIINNIGKLMDNIDSLYQDIYQKELRIQEYKKVIDEEKLN